MAKTNKKAAKAYTTSSQKPKYLTRKEASVLLIESELALQTAEKHLQAVREVCSRAGLSVDVTIIVPRSEAPTNPAESSVGTTGGHSNTDHVVVRTGNKKNDRIAELKRNLLRRHRAMQPEHRGEDRWDKPRIPGERRRRIVREKDLPEAPPEPPHTGFVVFVGQMTTKIRHDRPDVPHNQSKVTAEISKIWRIGMSEEDRIYYNTFANDARNEYDRQVIEYRATGRYTPSKQFSRLDGTNIWIRRYGKNGLEKEISEYDTCQFPKRPASMDEAYERREERSILKRKLKQKGLLNEDGTLKDGLDFEELLLKERQKNQSKKKGSAGPTIMTADV